ncbi:MAG: hypothetical protein J6Z14_08735 [Prevotella sp.]|nr:hypothetical protein [Prevotella sp.]
MKPTRLGAYLLCAILLIAACHPGRHDRMVAELANLQVLNQADSLLTDDSLAQALADYFDDHGTPNEQMEAHYLLGRTHADRGEAPAAIAAYHDAIDHADTAAGDCNYRQLCRVYAQMAKIFYQQNLVKDNLVALEQSIRYGLKGKDTLSAINAYAHKIPSYKRLQMHDSVIYVGDILFNQYYQSAYKQFVSRNFAAVIPSLLEKGLKRKAKNFIDIYERESGYFDSLGNIMSGREAFYNYKGLYYETVGRLDSTEYYLRKELTAGKDIMNQNMASRGLSKLFLKKNMPDSAAKYAIYSYEMNDSVYAQMATAEVEKAQNIYNYTRHKEQSIREKERADKEHLRFIILGTTSFLAGAFGLLLYRRKVKKQQEERNEYEETKRKYRKLLQEKEELNNLAKNIMDEEESNRAKLNDIIKEKAKEIKQLEDKLNHYNIDTLNITDTLENVYKKSDIYEVLEPKIKKGNKLSDEDLEKIENFAQQNMQSLYSFLESNNLSDNKKRYTCFLFRLHLGVKDVSNLLGVSPSYISQISKNMAKTLFSESGNSKELKKELLKFDRTDLISTNI